jgi:peptide/nickel transport system substrate-binding protein
VSRTTSTRRHPWSWHRPRRTGRRPGALALGLALGALVATVTGCGAPGSGTGQRADDTFTYDAGVAVITDWDPATSYSNELWVLQNVYESLTAYDFAARRVVPRLATSWRSEAGGRTWTFTLRDAVAFHTGRPLTSTAVKEAIERTRRLGGGASYLWSALTRVDTPNPATVVFRLASPQPLDIVASAQYGAYIYDTRAAGTADLTTWLAAGHDAGTGPYRVVEWRKGQENEVRLHRFDGYWKGWSGERYRQVVFRVTPDQSTAFQLVRRGEVDYVQRLNPDLFHRLAGSPGVRTSESGSLQNLVALLNTASGPLADPRLRRALSAAVDYAGTVRALRGAVTASSGIVPAGLLGHDPSLAARQDLARAGALLGEAGYGPGRRRLTLTLTHSTGDADVQAVATLLRSTLDRLNVTLTVTPLEWQAQWERAKSAGTASRQDIFLFYWFPDSADAYSWFSNLFRSASPPLFNLAYYADPAVDAEIDRLPRLTTADPEAAQRSYVSLQRRVLREDAVAIVFYQQRYQRVLAASVRGFVDNPAYANVVFVHDLTRGR